MSELERDIRAAILRALLAAKGAMTKTAVKQYLRNVYPHLALSDTALEQHIAAAINAGLVCEAEDDVVGTILDLTLNGKTRASQL